MTSNQQRQFAVGLMSGTSADGVDAALVRTDGESAFERLDFLSVAYPDDLRRRITQVASQPVPIDLALQLEQEITNWHVTAVNELLSTNEKVRSQVTAIGFHGHTIRHEPRQGYTWQIGDAAKLAQQTGLLVISDFRRRDMAAGGQGAPLAALFHAMLFADHEKPLAILNLGGVANVTWIGEDGQMIAGDTGPGCGLLDAWTWQTTGQPYDRDGVLADGGAADRATVEMALAAPYFEKDFPKSADRFEFAPLLPTELSAEDGAATLCAVTVESVANTIDRLGNPRAVWVTGGGARHPTLMRLLAERFVRVAAVEQCGLHGDSLEAECFAWLAVRRLRGLVTTLPSTTGCRNATCGGVITQA